jgi:hypothetical protein
MNPKSRRQDGNMLVLVVVTIAIIVVPLLILISQSGLFMTDYQRIQNTVQAAGLLAANDISRIVVSDPIFGYVSLSNFPPIGKGTLASDGEPLPVTGINTIVGTLRQNALVAKELGNQTMLELVDKDRLALQSTVKHLNRSLADALADKKREKYRDINGEQIDPNSAVLRFLAAHLPPGTRLESMTLTNGWLTNDGTTTVSIPQPVRYAQVKSDHVRGSFYKPFVDVPVGKLSFSFGGIGTSSAIVQSSKFNEVDSTHICSVVKLDCAVARKDPCQPKETHVRFIVYCQPYSLPDIGPAGVMTVRFSSPPAPGLLSWANLLNENNFRDRQVNTYDAIGGDYPTDKAAHMRQIQTAWKAGSAQEFSEHLYYWLRNGHLLPRIDAVLAMVNDPFQFGPNAAYVYEFARDGSISRRILPRYPFAVGILSEAQVSAVVDTSITNGMSPVIIFRNNIKHLGADSGGKHGGQPLAGDPLNWCELQEYGGDERTAAQLNKGKFGTRLTIVDPANSSLSDTFGAVNRNLFLTIDGKTLLSQPRKSFYSGGLAIDIEIGGIREPTANLDVRSAMSRFKRARI